MQNWDNNRQAADHVQEPEHHPIPERHHFIGSKGPHTRCQKSQPKVQEQLSFRVKNNVNFTHRETVFCEKLLVFNSFGEEGIAELRGRRSSIATKVRKLR